MTDKPNPPFHERIYAARMKRGWSQQKLADKMGTARSRVSAIECGATEPTVSWLLRAAEALKVSARGLLPRNDYY